MDNNDVDATTDNKDFEYKRNDKGRFVKGNKPPTSFRDRPQDRYSEKYSKDRMPSYQYKRFWGMDTEEVILLAKQWKIIEWSKEEKEEGLHKRRYPKHTMVEEACLRRIIEANKSLQEMKEVTNRVEGLPTQKIEATVENRFKELGDKELKDIAEAYDGEE